MDLHRSLLLTALVSLATVLIPLPAGADKLGLNLYGLSYRWNQEPTLPTDWRDNLDSGLGLRYHLGPHLGGQSFLDAASYRDALGNSTRYTALGLLWPAGDHRRLRLGWSLTAFESPDYNGGDPFLTTLPMLSYHLDGATLNAVHFPKTDNFSDQDTTNLFVTIPLP